LIITQIYIRKRKTNLPHILKIVPIKTKRNYRTDYIRPIIFRRLSTSTNYNWYQKEVEESDIESTSVTDSENKMTSVTNTSSLNERSNSAINELHGLTNDLVESQSAHGDIQVNRTLAFQHDLGSIITRPLPPNLVAPSAISSKPAIESDYPPLDDTETPRHFIADDIELHLVYSDFIEDHQQELKTSMLF
ncbi:hypothetical protein CROQUDRAFT_679122, partial [Cronartium quercuum f. sp. fusiforme G11]